MQTRDRAHTHLENARVLFQENGNKTTSRIDLYAANILSLLEEAVDTQNLCMLEMMAKTSANLRAAARRLHRNRRNEADALIREVLSARYN